MSPTIPPIFALSLLLFLPLPTMAGELMDLFTLIRRTLKYWRKIYQMYEEEVVLGYCWAEYFLYQEGDMKSDLMSTPTPMNSSNCVSNEVENFERPIAINTYDTNTWNHWITGVNDRYQEYHRNKRSYKVLKTKEKERNPISRSNELILNLGSDKNGNLVNNMLIHSILSFKKDKKKIVIKSEKWNDYIMKSVVFDMDSKITQLGVELSKRNSYSKVDKEIDPVNMWYKRFSKNQQEDCMCSLGVSNSMNTSIKDISEIPGNYFVRDSTTSNLLTKTDKIKLNSNFKSKDIDPVRDRTEENYSTLVPKYLLRMSKHRKWDRQEITNVWDIILLKRNKQGQSIQKSIYNDSHSRLIKWKLPLNFQRLPLNFDSWSVKCLCRIDSPQFSIFDGASYFVRSLTSPERRANEDDGSSPQKRVAVIVKEFKGSRAEGEHDGKSKNLRVDTRRKFLYSRTNSVTSGTPSRLELRGSRSSSLGRVASLNSRFKDRRMDKKLEDNRKPGNFQNRRKFGSSYNEFQGVEQRQKRSFQWNYRRNLRRKRDANNRIKTDAVQLRSKNEEASSNNPTSRNEIPRFSWKYVPLYESRSNNDQETFERSVKHLLTAKIYVLPKIPVYNSEEAPHGAFPAFRGIRRLPSNLVGISSHSLNTSSDHIRLKNPSEDKNRKEQENDRNKGSNFKQLLGIATNDNRYQRTEHEFLVKKPVGTGRKAILYPTGQPSLLPVTYSRFIADYGRAAQNTRPGQSSGPKNQGQRFPATGIETRGLSRADGMLFYLHQVLMSFLRTLGFFMSVGRQLMDYVDSNTALACTKDYLVGKAMHWIDS